MTAASENAPSRRRGRPYRFPEDSSPMTRVHGGVEQRVAWLLSASRIHAEDPDMAHRDQFVPALKGLGIAADQARVSRWESGGQRAPEHLVTAYEQVLGLAPGHLSAAVRGLRASLSPEPTSATTSSTSPEQLHADLDKLFEQVDGDNPHGSSWLELTTYLTTHPQIYLREKTWRQLAKTLITELGRSVGAAYTRRFEALRILVRHPGAQRHVVKSIGEFVTDPAAQVVMHPLTLLQEVEHRRAGDLAMRLLTTETGMLQQGAAWVIAAKIPRGHFNEQALRQVEAVALMLLTSPTRAIPDVDVLDVAARLPKEAAQRLLLALHDHPASPRFDQLTRTGEILPQDITRTVAREVADAAQAATPPPYRIEPDMMLQRLVREALFHGHQERRHQAGVLLTVSPYRAGVAAALAPAIDNTDESVAHQAMMLMRYVGTEAEREQLARWAQDETRPQIRGLAMISLGRLPKGIRPEEEGVVLRGLDGDAKRPAQRASLYALGMGGAIDPLNRLTDSDDEFVRGAARWWLRTGPGIHESSTMSGQD